MAETKDKEITVPELTTVKNHVFFPGKAMMSEKGAPTLEAALETAKAEEAPAPKKKESK